MLEVEEGTVYEVSTLEVEGGMVHEVPILVLMRKQLRVNRLVLLAAVAVISMLWTPSASFSVWK